MDLKNFFRSAAYLPNDPAASDKLTMENEWEISPRHHFNLFSEKSKRIAAAW